MPLFYQQHINQHTKLAIWKIEETEDFFLQTVQLQRYITHPNKRLQHLAGRYLLKHLYPDFPNELILVASTRKPYLINEAYHFSISHCGDYAAAIVSKIEKVGIDIEFFSEKILNMAHKFTGADEVIEVQKITRLENHQTSLTLIWSAKETMFKWYGLGNVDFKKMLNVANSNNNKTDVGDLSAIINIQEKKIDLNINYKIFESMILTYINTN
jgi:phosphopantetheinyl transferase